MVYSNLHSSNSKKEIYFLLTIDTEEDQWGVYNGSEYTCNNIRALPAFHSLATKFGVLPTYLITHQVTLDPFSREFFKGIAKDKSGEIGVHCHPWNSPPFLEPGNEFNSMLSNLSFDIQYEKISRLKERVDEICGLSKSFRAGRWALSNDVVRNLKRLNFTVDSSATPFYSWIPNGQLQFSGLGVPSIYYLDGSERKLLEVTPTISFVGPFASVLRKYPQVLQSKIARFCRIPKVASYLGTSLVWLTPELSSFNRMVQLIDELKVQEGKLIFNVIVHSQSLSLGFSPYARVTSEVNRIIETFTKLFELKVERGWRAITLSDSHTII